MHYFRRFLLFSVLIIAFLFTFCTSPTKSSNNSKKQSVVIDNIEFVDGVDNNENGYFSSVTLRFRIRVTTGDLTVNVGMVLYNADSEDYVGGGILEDLELSSLGNFYTFNISDFPQDDYYIELYVYDPVDQEKLYLTVTPDNNSTLGDLSLEMTSDDVSFYVRLINTTFTDIDLWLDDDYYFLESGTALRTEYDYNPGTIGFYAETMGKTGDTEEQIGRVMVWDTEFTTSGSDSFVTNLTIGDGWFFLFMRNNTAYEWRPIDVNVGMSEPYYRREDIRIPADGGLYRTGYFDKFSETVIYAFLNGDTYGSPYTFTGLDYYSYTEDTFPNRNFWALCEDPSNAKIGVDELAYARDIGDVQVVKSVKPVLKISANIQSLPNNKFK